MANADIACHLAKADGRNKVHLFSHENDAKRTMDNELGWSARLQDALRNDRFALTYQPIVSTERIDFSQLPDEAEQLWQPGSLPADGGASDYEVLLRLQASDGTLIGPDAFFAHCRALQHDCGH